MVRMSLRRAARVFACLAFASLAASSPARADEPLDVDHAPDLTPKVYQVADLIVPLASADSAKGHPDFDWLLDLIELRTGADCWTHSGGQGSIKPDEATLSLIIRQTQATHECICDLLDEIRKTGDLALCVEIQLIHGNLDAFGDGKPNRTAQGLVDSSGKERLLQFLRSQADSEIVAAPRITFFNGTTASLETTDHGCTKTFSVRGVISKDNRYSRLWLDAKVEGQTTKAEVLVPEGHTAVRKLSGHNSWLLVTSHVINAEEPQVIGPLKSEEASPVEQKKRYLVPVDDSPEPTELTAIPQFKAQAEGFGLAIQRKGAVESGVESDAGSVEAQPELASAVERVEYQVAEAEPRHVTNFELAPPAVVYLDSIGVHELPSYPAAFSFVGLDHGPDTGEKKPASTFEMYPLKNPRPEATHLSGLELRMLGEKAEAPYSLWIGDVLEKTAVAPNDPVVVPAPSVVHSVNVEPVAVDPPARLEVCLDDAQCRPAPKAKVQPGQMLDRIFVTPAPAFPMPWNELNGHANGGSITIDHWDSRPPVTISHIELGRRAILSQPKTRSVGGAIITGPAPVGAPKLQFMQNDLLIMPDVGSARVRQASGAQEPVESIETHLTTAATALEELGLTSEAKVVHALLHSIHIRAEERCQQIDQEIARLKAARKKLQGLANPESAAEAESTGQTR
jgi:hypothetical protein